MSPRMLVGRLGRVLLWALLIMMLLRGAAEVLAGDRPVAKRGAGERVSVAGWSDDAARAFAAQFVLAYLSWLPGDVDGYGRRLARFVAPDLVRELVPRLDRTSRQARS